MQVCNATAETLSYVRRHSIDQQQGRGDAVESRVESCQCAQVGWLARDQTTRDGSDLEVGRVGHKDINDAACDGFYFLVTHARRVRRRRLA